MISVIIPLHNLGRKGDYCLRRCLDSLLAQTYTDFEVLLMENGSDDDTVEIAQEYCNKDIRFKLHILDTVGVSNARNRGIDLAKGEYISFIDGDDFISDDYLSAGNIFITTNPGISFITFSKSFYYLKTNKCKNIINIAEDSIYPIKDRIETSIIGIVSKIVKKSLFTNNMLYFNTSLINGEDMLVSYLLYTYSLKYAVSSHGIYYYTQGRTNQTTSNIDVKKLPCYMENNLVLINLLTNELMKQHKLEANEPILSSFFVSIFIGNKFAQTYFCKMKISDTKKFINKHLPQILHFDVDNSTIKPWQKVWFKRFQYISSRGGLIGCLFIKFMRIYRNLLIQPFRIKYYQ